MSDSSLVEILCGDEGVTWTKIDKGAMDMEKQVIALDTAIKSEDKRTIIKILTQINSTQRMKLVEAYKIKFGKDVTLVCSKPKLGRFESKRFKDVVQSLIISLPQYLARELNRAMTSRGDKDAILEILCAHSNKMIFLITSEYELAFGRPGSTKWVSLVEDDYDEKDGDPVPSGRRQIVIGRSLEMDLWGMDAAEDFKRFCIALSLGARSPETTKTREELVQADALALHHAGGGKYWWSDDENETPDAVELAVWVAIFTQRSHRHLLKVMAAYKNLTGTSIEETIKKQFSGYVKSGFLTLVSCIRNRAKYFAERLHKTMKGIGTDDDTLIRVIISNADAGFNKIKQEFANLYDCKLEKWIESDTSGAYKNILLSIINPPME